MENIQQFSDLERRITILEEKLSYPLDLGLQKTIEMTFFNNLKILKSTLAVLTAVPTYNGINGEIVLVKTGATPNEVYNLYAHIQDDANPPVFAWRKLTAN